MALFSVEETLTIFENFEKFDNDLKQKIKRLFNSEINFVNPHPQQNQTQTETEDECYFKSITIKGTDEVKVRKAKNYLTAVFDTTSTFCEIFEYDHRYDTIVLESFDMVEQMSSAHLLKDNGSVLIFGINPNVLSVAESLLTKAIEDNKRMGYIQFHNDPKDNFNSNITINLIEDDFNLINDTVISINSTDQNYLEEINDNKMDISSSDGDLDMDVDKTPDTLNTNHKLANSKSLETSDIINVDETDETLPIIKNKKKRKKKKRSNAINSAADVPCLINADDLLALHLLTETSNEKIESKKLTTTNQISNNQFTSNSCTKSTTNNFFSCANRSGSYNANQDSVPLKNICAPGRDVDKKAIAEPFNITGGCETFSNFKVNNDNVGLDFSNKPSCSRSKRPLPFHNNKEFSVATCNGRSRSRDNNRDIRFVNYRNNGSVDRNNTRHDFHNNSKRGIYCNEINLDNMTANNPLPANNSDDDLIYCLDKNGSDNKIDNDINKSGKVSKAGMLRPIVIDGSNVAMHHGLSKFFSCKGIELVINYFKHRGHKQITAFVPQWRRASSSPGNNIRDLEILEKLYNSGVLSFTPSRRVRNICISSYDDRYILKHAAEEQAIVISNDQFKDLYKEPMFKETIEERLMQVTFVGDKVMFPDDPLGRNGPTLDEFLKFPDEPANNGHQMIKPLSFSNLNSLTDPLFPEVQNGIQCQLTSQQNKQQNDQQNLLTNYLLIQQQQLLQSNFKKQQDLLFQQQPRLKVPPENLHKASSIPNNLSSRFPFLNSKKNTASSNQGGSSNTNNVNRPASVTEALRKTLLKIYKGQNKQINVLLEQNPFVSDINYFIERCNHFK